MLSSSRKQLAVAAGLVLAGAQTQAADAYFIPQVEVRAEHHDNLELLTTSSGSNSNVEGYFADLGGIVGWRSERGLTEFRPRITVQEYPDRKDLQRSNQYLDWRSEYQSLRSEFQWLARYSRQDQYRAEVPQAAYDAFDPTDPTANESGRVVILSETQTRVQVRPEYLYHFSERVGIGFDGLYQSVSYDSKSASQHVDYDASELTGFLQWALGQRTDLKTGLYGSRYAADDDSNTTTGKGVSFELEHRWTETFTGTAELTGERTKIEEVGFPTEETDNWGLTVGAVKQGPISSVRFDIGRSFSPTSGARAAIDQVRVQYYRGLTQRLQFNGALRGLQRQAQGNDTGNNDRKYARGDIGLQWNVTPTWYMGGGYSYIWQKYERDSSSADDQVFMVSFGYRGRPPQR